MNIHKNARTTPYSRRPMAGRVAAGERVAKVAGDFCVSEQTVRKWVGRWRRGGEVALGELRATTDTPPDPGVNTVSPAASRRWPVSPTQAVTAAQGGSRFLEREMARHAHQRFLPQHRIVREHAVKVGAEPVGQVIGRDRTAEPARMKGADNPVTDLDPHHALANGRDLAAPSLNGTTQSFVGPRPPPLRTIKSGIERAGRTCIKISRGPGRGSSLARNTISSTLPKRSM
jgi:Homeodomain-like domain